MWVSLGISVGRDEDGMETTANENDMSSYVIGMSNDVQFFFTHPNVFLLCFQLLELVAMLVQCCKGLTMLL